MKTNASARSALIPVLSLLAATAVASPQPDAQSKTSEPAPPGVEQLMPRGRIAAILDPVFVAASEAEIPDDAWVLGVAIDDEARAYSLNLLNSH